MRSCSLSKPRILYAEDEFTNRKLLEIQLGKSGFICDLAADGLQALEKVKETLYDLIILDQYMPGMNGDVLAPLIRDIQPGVPLLAITSDDAESDRLRDAGFLDVFIKPLRGTEYIEIIKMHIERSRAGV
jgi:CheY-like chemotaxis protein